MRGRQRLLGVVLILGGLAAVKIGHQTYRWYVHDEERARIESLSVQLKDVAVEIVATQLVSDSLREEIQEMDARLADARQAISAYEKHAVGGALPGHLYEPYTQELDQHNQLVVARNADFERWRSTISRNHAAVSRYNALADSIRATAAEMGEPYYTIPTPAEVALERGISPPS